MAKTPTKAPKKDKANRPSPPDRDGDGASGGSLPGNETAEEAKHTAEEALAHAQIAADGMATIIIKGATTGQGASHPVGVNGKFRHVAVNVEVQVNAAELAVIEASHIEFETVVPLAEAPVEDAAEAAGVEGSSSAAAVDSPVEPEPETTAPEGADEVTQSEGETPAA